MSHDLSDVVTDTPRQGLDEALEYLLEEEGGFSNHPSDRGGKTMYGVTQQTYDGYNSSKGLPKTPVATLHKEVARDIYREEYWTPCGADRLPWPISYLTFDAAVNSGVSRAVKWTQAGLGVPADGTVGHKTLESAVLAIQSGDSPKILAIVDQRVQFLASVVKSQPTQLAFLLGWWRRTLRVLGRALLSELDN